MQKISDGDKEYKLGDVWELWGALGCPGQPWVAPINSLVSSGAVWRACGAGMPPKQLWAALARRPTTKFNEKLYLLSKTHAWQRKTKLY